MNKIIITGALGHIGSALIRYLPKKIKNLEIIIIDDLSTQRFGSLFKLPKNSKFKFIFQDIKKIKNNEIFKDVKVLIHLSAQTDASSSFENPKKLFKNNLDSTKFVIKKCIKFNIPLIFASTTSVYGTQKKSIDENCSKKDLKPQSPYAECKLKEEDAIKSSNNKLKYTIFRFGTIYGISPGMRFHTAVNKFCFASANNLPLTVWKTAYNQKRPYLDLHDCLNVITFFILNNIFDSKIYNVVTDNLTVKDIINQIKKYNNKVKVKFVDHKIMNQLSYEVKNYELSKTKFKFKGNIKKGIEDTLKLLEYKNC